MNGNGKIVMYLLGVIFVLLQGMAGLFMWGMDTKIDELKDDIVELKSNHKELTSAVNASILKDVKIESKLDAHIEKDQ